MVALFTLTETPAPSLITNIILGTDLPQLLKYEGWNFNSGNYLFTTDTK